MRSNKHALLKFLGLFPILFLLLCWTQRGIASTSPVVAVLLGKPISLHDLGPSSRMFSMMKSTCHKKIAVCINQYRFDRLHYKIMHALFSQFAQQNNIRVSEGEIRSYCRIFQKFDRDNPVMKQYAQKHASVQEKKAMEAVREEVAKTQIKNWKIQALLYKKYGGRVIFQQLNPEEPVDAIEHFLKLKQKQGAFKILNAAYNQKFWHYFNLPHTVLEKKDVNFDKPWWEQTAK